MSIFENAADLLHELKVAAGTVLTILGSKLEADARARVECGPQWLTEFEEQRDSLEPDEACAFHGEWCAGEASWCTRQCNKCDEAVYWHRDVEAWFHCAGVNDRRPCPYGDGPVVEHSSAASALAADPSPTGLYMATADAGAAVGGEGPGGASDIPQSAPPGRSTAADLLDAYANLRAEYLHGVDPQPANELEQLDSTTLMLWTEVESIRKAANILRDPGENYLGLPSWRWDEWLALIEPSPVPPVVAGESPGEEDEQPSLGELEAAWREFTDGVATFGIEVEDVYAASQMRLLADCIDPPTAVSHEDLAAHLTGAAIRANTGHPDVLIDAFASSLLADFNITRREAAGE